MVLAVTDSTQAWTATANDPWLHLDASRQSGTGGANVVFTFEANPGATRTGTLTVAGQTLTVTQAASTYVAANPVTTLVSTAPASAAWAVVDGFDNPYFDTLDTTDGNLVRVEKWSPATGQVTTLVSGGLDGFVVDGVGNIYYSDKADNAIRKWTAATGEVATLVSAYEAQDVALDNEGNVYFSEGRSGAVKKWTAATGKLITLLSTMDPQGLALDPAGNVYVMDRMLNVILEWRVATGTVTTLVSSGLTFNFSITFDGAGNIIFPDHDGHAIKKWWAASGEVTRLASTGLSLPLTLALDGAGDIYFADFEGQTFNEIPRAFVDPAARTVTAAAGRDVLPPVLPATVNLRAPFSPTSSDPSWLTINGATNGLVSYSFSANTTPDARTAQITLLGKHIAITQAGAGAVEAPVLTGPARMSNGIFDCGFTGTPGASYSVWFSSNAALPLSAWTSLGPAVNTAGNQFHFLAPFSATPTGFYRVSSP